MTAGIAAPGLHVSLRTRFVKGLAAVLLPFLVAAAVGLFHLLPRLVGPLDDIVREFTETPEPVTHLQMALIHVAIPVNDFPIHGNPDEPLQFAQLRQRVEQVFDVDAGVLLCIIVSIGVASWPAHADSGRH